MVPQDQFVAARHRDWEELDLLLPRAADWRSLDGPTISRIAALFRALCTDLMRCDSAGYTSDLSTYLHALAARAHNTIYGEQSTRVPAFLRQLWWGFPRALRRNIWFFVASAALFFIPAAIGVLGAVHSTQFAFSVLPAEMLDMLAEAYSEGFAAGRATGMDTAMAGFYVYNNVGIAFRCFATGILFGAGSIFFLLYNGLVTGTVAGYVIQMGGGANILTFMCGHAPFELTAIVIAGGAGLQMGYALVRTGGRTRLGSLRQQAPELAQLVLGAAGLLLIAAAIEGFWSPSSIPAPIKWAFSAVSFLLMAAYLGLAGRSRSGRGHQGADR